MATAELIEIRRNSEVDGCPLLNGSLIASIAWLQSALTEVPADRRHEATIAIKEDVYTGRVVVFVEYPA